MNDMEEKDAGTIETTSRKKSAFKSKLSITNSPLREAREALRGKILRNPSENPSPEENVEQENARPSSLHEPEVQLRVKKKNSKSKRRERHTLPASSNVAFEPDEVSLSIRQLEDDLQEVNQTPSTPHQIDRHEIPSTPVQTVYMEVRDGFRTLDSSQLQISTQRQPVPNSNSKVKQMMSDLALLWHAKFGQLCKLSHGLLAGIALSHCLVIFALSPPSHTWDDFLSHYSPLAHGFRAVFHFLNVICVISVFDRYDLTRIDWGYFSGLCQAKFGILSMLLYPLSLLLTLCVTNTDDHLGLYQHTNSTVWWGQLKDTENMLQSWRSVSLVRSIGILFAWFLFGISSDEDLLEKHLKEIT